MITHGSCNQVDLPVPFFQFLKVKRETRNGFRSVVKRKPHETETPGQENFCIDA
jgi:hypothetical protein